MKKENTEHSVGARISVGLLIFGAISLALCITGYLDVGTQRFLGGEWRQFVIGALIGSGSLFFGALGLWNVRVLRKHSG